MFLPQYYKHLTQFVWDVSCSVTCWLKLCENLHIKRGILHRIPSVTRRFPCPEHGFRAPATYWNSVYFSQKYFDPTNWRFLMQLCILLGLTLHSAVHCILCKCIKLFTLAAMVVKAIATFMWQRIVANGYVCLHGILWDPCSQHT